MLDARKIIVIDDNHDDQFFIKKALKEAGIENMLIPIYSGEDAIDFILNGKELNGQHFTDDIKFVILDLKMPRVDGFEVLKAIKGSPKTSHLEVIVLATSDKDPDIKRIRELGANSYVVKPFTVAEFIKVVSDVGSYWINTDRM